MESEIFSTGISADQKCKQPKSVIKGLPEQLGSGRYGSPQPVLLPFQLYGANFNLFMSHLNLILNHLMQMKNSVH